MASSLIKPKQLQHLKPGQWVADPAPRGSGRLQARGLAGGGVAFYFRYTDPAGDRVRLPLGTFAVDGVGGLSLKEARDLADQLSKRYQAGDRDLRGALDADASAERAHAAAQQAEEEAEASAKAATLGALCEAYADALERHGKASHRSVRNALRKNVRAALPRLWEKPAADVTADDGLDVLEKLTSAGKLREASKVRAYLRAAYATAINARTKPDALPALRKLRIRSNPIRDLGTVEGANRSRDRALSVAEIQAYWSAISALPDPAGALLRAHLLTGGQRYEQLARATAADIDHDAGALLLLDNKGRRSEARRHWVPLLPEVLADLARLRNPNLGPAVFTLSYGARPATHGTVSARVRAVAAAMVEAGTASAPFTLGDLRRTVETRLAGLGVPLEIRAQLQSHGLGGLQARHYDRYDYAAEKRAALEQLRDLAMGTSGTVTAIASRRRSRTAG